nr:hypothetical protein [uncultured Chitinophaga sp.]
MYPKLLPFLLLICLSVLCACTKSENPTAPPQTDIVDEAKLFFESQVLTGKDGEGTPKPESIVKLPFAKSADWSKAVTQNLAFGKTVVVPLKIDNIYVSSDKGKTKQLLQNNAYLVLYKIDSKFKAEVLYKYPAGNSLKGKFTGDIIVQSWDGTVTNSFRYVNGIGKKITTYFVEPNKPQAESSVECVTNDYYYCTSVGNEEYCSFNGSTTKCYLNEDGSSGGEGYPDTGGGSSYGGAYSTNISTSVVDMSETGAPVKYNKILCAATGKVDRGFIVEINGIEVRPEFPVVTYQDNGRTVTRTTKIMDLKYTIAPPLPSPAVTITWTYYVNYTYNYVPYAKPLTRQSFRTTSVNYVAKP